VAKTQSRFICQNCGAEYRKWTGRCDACGEWNSIEEERVESGPKATGGIAGGAKGKTIEFVALEGESASPKRLISGIAELDRACGGGLVPGSALLVGGDPGIGKSTILLQAVGAMAAKHKCAYISGEEAVDQVRMRAARLGLEKSKVEFAAATSLRDIITTLEASNHDVVVIDSIQTMYADTLDSAPGTVSQVRACALELIRLAKRKGFAVLLVGHVTKEGQIAGPRVLEHMVDTVLYFEGVTKSAYLKWVMRDWSKSPTRPHCFWPIVTPQSAARRSLPDLKARVRCWWKFRRLSRNRPSPPRAVLWSAGILHA